MYEFNEYRTKSKINKSTNILPQLPHSSSMLPNFGLKLISPLLVSYPKYKKPSYSSEPKGVIRMYGVNSYKGLVKNYNEDRVSIVLNIKKPKDYVGYWPDNLSIFGLFDGHAGNACSEFLKNYFHIYLMRSELFPRDLKELYMIFLVD